MSNEYGLQEMSSDEEMDEMMHKMQLAVSNTNCWMWNATQVCTLNWKEVRNDRPMTGEEWIRDILQGHHQRCHDEFRMYTDSFLVLCDKVKQQGIIKDGDVTIEEQVGMFLQTVAHSDPMRKVGESFQHSIETVSRCFHNVLRSILRFETDYIKLPTSDAPIPPKVVEETYAPFKGALGAIDGTHIPAFPDPHEQNKERFRNRKQINSQNVMAVVDFDGNFLAVVAGWEGSTHDNHILRKAIDDGFVVPPNRYYLVDGGYANSRNFISPYRGRPYHLGAFERRQRRRRNRYECPEDLFNHRHAQLRNIVEKTFGILKNRFKICQWMHKYKYKTQTKIVIACCILHNFIKQQNKLQNISDEAQFDVEVENNISTGDTTILGDLGATDGRVGEGLKESIKNMLWSSRRN